MLEGKWVPLGAIYTVFSPVNDAGARVGSRYDPANTTRLKARARRGE